MEQVKVGKKSSPATSLKRQMLFLVRVNGAKAVLLAGDFTRWSEAAIPLSKGTNDEWRTTLELEPGEYQYRLLIDGKWQDDAQAAKRVPNPFGGENCVFLVSAQKSQTS